MITSRNEESFLWRYGNNFHYEDGQALEEVTQITCGIFHLELFQTSAR